MQKIAELWTQAVKHPDRMILGNSGIQRQQTFTGQHFVLEEIVALRQSISELLRRAEKHKEYVSYRLVYHM